MAELRRIYVAVYFDGVLADDITERFATVEVDERSVGPSSARLVLDLGTDDDEQVWDALADERFQLLERITIALGQGPESSEDAEYMDTVFDGYITELSPRFGEERIPESALEVHAQCATALMHLEERVFDWTDNTDAEIVEAIFRSYGFDFEGSSRPTPERTSRLVTLLQRTTDLEQVVSMARRIGFDCYLEPRVDTPTEGDHPGTSVVGHFHPPRLDAELQHPLDLFPQTTTNVVDFELSLTSHAATRAVGRHIDTLSRTALAYEASASEVVKMGTTTRAELLRERLRTLRAGLPRRRDDESDTSQGATPEERAIPTLTQRGLHHAYVPTDATELEAITRGAWLDIDWVAEGVMTVAGTAYPAILRARRPVYIQGASPIFDGRWHVRRARHAWMNHTDYTVEIDVCRNALYANSADTRAADDLRRAAGGAS